MAQVRELQRLADDYRIVFLASNGSRFDLSVSKVEHDAIQLGAVVPDHSLDLPGGKWTAYYLLGGVMRFDTGDVLEENDIAILDDEILIFVPGERRPRELSRLVYSVFRGVGGLITISPDPPGVRLVDGDLSML